MHKPIVTTISLFIFSLIVAANSRMAAQEVFHSFSRMLKNIFLRERLNRQDAMPPSELVKMARDPQLYSSLVFWRIRGFLFSTAC